MMAALAPPMRLEHPNRLHRLAALVNTMDPKLVAAALGMNPEAVMIYASDGVDQARLPDEPSA